MNTFRSFFVLACIGAIIFAFLYAARPEWFSGIVASSSSASNETLTRKTTMVIPAHGRSLPATPEGTDVRQLVDIEDDGLPSRVNPYILVVNTNDHTLRHFRLSKSVKSVSLRSANADVVVKRSKVVNPDGPIQLEIWIPNSREITLDVEFQVPKR